MKSDKYLIGLDLGTSAIKGIIMSAGGKVISREKLNTEYSYPANGFVEFDVEHFYDMTVSVIRKLVAALPVNGSVAGISMASASGNSVLLDSYMRPLRPCISWLDARVTDELERIFGVSDPQEVHDLIGWPLLKQFPLAQLAWLKCHEPELLGRAAKVCMSTDYLTYRLTGKWGIDESTATTLYLRNQKEGKWHEPFLQKLGIPEWALPEVYPSGKVLGGISGEAAGDTGLLLGTPVILGAFDHSCAARGTGVMEEGQLMISCGTSWVGFYPSLDRSLVTRLGMLTDPYLSPKGPWGAMFSLSAVAAAIDRYICRYISGRDSRYVDFDRLAASAEPAPEGLYINPMVELEPENISRFSKAEIARALMEGTAFLFRMHIEKYEKAGLKTSTAVMVGGPSETYSWPQILCEVLGLTLASVNGSCAGAAGAAILAGIGSGLYRDERVAYERMNFSEIVYTPDVKKTALYDKMYREFVRKCM